MKRIDMACIRARSVSVGCALAAALWLAGCGGGGGSGSSAGSDPGAPAPSNSDPGYASLVPSPPALGVVLEADASVLIPQTAGASWRFWGRQTSASGSELARYESSYEWVQSGAEWLLKGSNPGNDGPDQARYAVSEGQLQQVEAVAFVAGQAAEEIRMTMLRSPVRAGDQILAFNKRVTGIPDQDGDGRTDSLDIAVYTRVIGSERVDTAMGEKVDAVRVETHVVQRLLYSKTGQPGPVQDIVAVEWFARGLGWVGREQPTFTADGQQRNGKESLLSAQVGEQGYGATGPVALVNPASSPEQAGQALAMQAPTVLSADARGVLLLSDPPVTDFSGRKLLTLLKTSGEVQWTRLSPPGVRFGAPLGAGWVLWGNLDGAAVIISLDAQGVALTSVSQTLDLAGPTTPLPSTHRNLQISADAQSLWVAAIRADWITKANGQLGPRDGIVVRGFDLNGNPRTPAVLLERSDQDGFMGGSPSLTVSNGNAYVAWTSNNGGQPHGMMMKVDATGATQQAAPLTEGVSQSTEVGLAGSPAGLLLSWGFDSRFSWIDTNLERSLLDATRSDGTLPPWPLNQPVGEQWVSRGDLFLRWGVEADASSGAVNGTSGRSLRWQLYRKGQAAPVRHSLVSSSVGQSDTLLIPLVDRILVISKPLDNEGLHWAVDTLWY